MARARHQQAAVRAELRTPAFQPHPAVEIHPLTPLGNRTFWVTHEAHPPQPTIP